MGGDDGARRDVVFDRARQLRQPASSLRSTPAGEVIFTVGGIAAGRHPGFSTCSRSASRSLPRVSFDRSVELGNRLVVNDLLLCTRHFGLDDHAAVGPGF